MRGGEEGCVAIDVSCKANFVNWQILSRSLNWVTYLRAYRNIRHNEIFSERWKCPREEETTQENLDYGFVSLTKYFAVSYISVCPQVR